ncbi:unnamed protein product [Didymodactylos carnosus]|uniref:Histidine-specific methyltransferase SAM-dependent domain-containing protein n=1 Tax=Didymodactylos carnosus TaxID=1234261 RepID=A0A814DQ32_9BILA|nr:unnamed protein product [Didymodactylos carnosus]CAF1162676.1 unnamed protein product [Didymodactylos carnosus]CAF3733494.1 unnamed protein product [Didymodactylos carnosus]CAF3974367.1 unnamed protein product [Didymodactylos carnosus]
MNEFKEQELNDDDRQHQDEFHDHVIKGLTSTPKYMDGKYNFDMNGDKILQQAVKGEQYYVYRCELEIVTKHLKEICQVMIADGSPFDLIDLGAGDATKSIHILKYMFSEHPTPDFTYMPIDISSNIISHLKTSLPLILPSLKMIALNGEYFEMLEKAMALSSGRRKVLIFFGQSIGNMAMNEAVLFCQKLRSYLLLGDMLLIGFDLQKHPKTILDAYDDRSGNAARLTLNILQRINRELNSNFDLSKFEHYPTYDPETGCLKIYLLSLLDQQVHIGSELIQFHKYESIHIGFSQKYKIQQIHHLASIAKFKTVKDFFDSKHWFVDSLWICE